MKVAIEDVPLGARVPTKNPNLWDYDDSLPEPEETTWAKFSFTIERIDGGIVDAELLRPRSWIDANGIRAGHSLPMHIEELQIDGVATVTAVEECPHVASGDGSAITGRFITREVDQIAVAKILGPDGHIETIKGTPTHPVWSVDQQDWIGIGDLQVDEILQGELGTATVLDVEIIHKPTPVYNIEVHGEHVYQVGHIGLLVHNTCPTNLGPYGSKAAKQISPGPRVLEGHYIDDLGRSQPWRAHYDQYGRQIARTDYNAGNRAAGIPDIHHHIYEYSPQFPLGREIASHVPGVF